MLKKKVCSRYTTVSFHNPLLYILLGLKIATVLTLNYFSEANYSDEWSAKTWLAYYSGDSEAYIKPIDNFISEGNYYIQEPHGKIYAGRAPYYGSIYFVIRQFFDYYTSLDILAFLQILTDCIAGLILASMAFRITKAEWTFWSTLLLYICSFYQTDYSGRILTESFSNSALIFFSYYLLKIFKEKTKINYLLAGFWLSVAVVLKPYFAPLYLLILLTYDTSKNPSKNIGLAVIFSISIVLITTPFTVRNYIRFGIIQPFSSFDGGTGITKGDFAYRKYLQSIGESIVFWDPNCAACLFTNENVPCYFEMPERVFTQKTDTSAIREARELYIGYLNERTQQKEKLVIEKFDSLREDYRNSKPFMYYAGSRILLLSRFIFQNASYYIPNPFKGNMFQIVQSIKAIQFSLYYFITLTGLTGIIILLRKNWKAAILSGAVPVYLLLFFPIVLRAIEWRFWTNSHYFLILSTVLIIHYFKGHEFKFFQKQ